MGDGGGTAAESSYKGGSPSEAPTEVPYGGKVYGGMPVRPRFKDIDMRSTFANEVYMSSLLAPRTAGNAGVQWGRYAVQQPHWKIKGEEEEANDKAEASGKDGEAKKPRR